MIGRIQLLRNVGQFDSVSTKIDLAKLTLVYAENGQGKTTLSAVLRSLATGEPLPIIERHRLGSAHPPEVIIACSGGPQPARFQNGAWSRTCADMAVFDDVFVDNNVYSGLAVAPDHRQNLHELIIGAQGVSLAHRVVVVAEEIRSRNTDLRGKTTALQGVDKQGFSIDEFCALPAQTDVDDLIAAAEKRAASIGQAKVVERTSGFASLALPGIDVEAIKVLLAKAVGDVDGEALALVKQHFRTLGKGGETWVSAGMDYVSAVATTEEQPCPFCRQGLFDSPMFAAYRAHFAAGYKKLIVEVNAMLSEVERTFRGDALAGFERQLQSAKSLQGFWEAFCSVPAILVDSTELAGAWQGARDALAAALKAKQADPLQGTTLDADALGALARLGEMDREVKDLSALLARANEDIDRVKAAARSGSAAATDDEIKRLRASKQRYEPAIAILCGEYLDAQAAKAQTEQDKVAAQGLLDAHRTAVFPQYQSAINSYLVLFNAGFSVEQVKPQNAAGTPSCTYHLGINKHKVPITGSAGATFKNTLSAGDRNTLALAFFFASLDRDPSKGAKVVVLDDPVSSLDEHRSLATVQEARKLLQHVAQVIVLSHSKPFLARIWQHSDQTKAVAVQVTRDTIGSTIEAWNVNDDSVTEYDRRHARLREFFQSNSGDARDTAQAIRPVLEGYLRVACPADFRPGTLLGPFRQLAKDRAAGSNPVLAEGKVTELGDLTEYGNKFHHDTNPAWDVESINDGELRGFVRRTLAFVGP